MSELINNRSILTKDKSDRQEMLKQIIKELHNGKSVDEVKAKFEEAVGDVTVAEISRMEHDLMTEEGIPVEEVQHLCSVHTAIFKGSIEEIHRSEKPENQPGHPVHTWKAENKEIDLLTNFKLALHKDRFEKEDTDQNRFQLLEDLNLLMDLDKHYSRKENLLFPYLEKYGIEGPTKVMWGVDDSIRSAIKSVKNKLNDYKGNKEEITRDLDHIISEVNEMIFKEENILFPLSLETLTEDEWVSIASESDEIGYCLTSPQGVWEPVRHHIREDKEKGQLEDGHIRFETGIVTVKQLETLLNHLPIDITFVDENDIVRYFSQGQERIFARTKAIIGRSVQNCHPPQSVHVVQEILADFKSGVKDSEDFWIPFKDMFVYIRYFALRDENGKYLGTVEVTENVANIRALEGQKRILS